jgi:FkbM family methyltransferase
VKPHKILRKAKAKIEKLPGAFRLYKWLTSRWGEGRVYAIDRGPMRGIVWRRDNRFPFWYHLGLYEPHFSGLIASTLRPGDTFGDLGAHAGYHSMMAARVVGPTGRVISVEPTPFICDFFREQLALNDLENCTVVQTAIADRDGRATLMRKAADSRTSTLAEVDAAGDPLEVPTLAVDTMASSYPPPRMLKMDIEGAEVLALSGGERLFGSADRPVRVVIATHGSRAHDFTRTFLLDRGYVLRDLPGFEPATLVADDPAQS